jgi:hypothetical protein
MRSYKKKIYSLDEFQKILTEIFFSLFILPGSIKKKTGRRGERVKGRGLRGGW